MFTSLKHEWTAKVAFLLFIVFTVFWIYLQFFINKNDILYQIFAAIYGSVALWGAICGIAIALKWGGIKSLMGKSLLMFSLGLCLQEFGQLAYSYYLYYQHITIPYPSIGDIGYFGSIPCYIYGVLLIAKASGVTIKLKYFKHKLQAIIIPLLMLSVAYVLFLQSYKFDFTHPLTIFLDFGYPFGQAIYIALAIITFTLSRGSLGGIMKNKILFILFALFVQFLSDFTYLYQAKNNTAYAGSFNDMLYLLAYFLMAYSLIQFNTVLKKLRSQ